MIQNPRLQQEHIELTRFYKFFHGQMMMPSGKRLHNYGKPPFLIGNSTISMAMFNSYVSLPEEKSHCIPIYHHKSIKIAILNSFL